MVKGRPLTYWERSNKDLIKRSTQHAKIKLYEAFRDKNVSSESIRENARFTEAFKNLNTKSQSPSTEQVKTNMLMKAFAASFYTMMVNTDNQTYFGGTKVPSAKDLKDQ